MSGINSASVSAGPLFRGSNGLVIMGGSLYIHHLTPEVAAQWLPILETIAKDGK